MRAEQQKQELEISVARAHGTRILFVFLQTGLGVSACRIRKCCLEIRSQTWATNKAKSGSSSLHPFSRPSLSPLTKGAGDRESSGVSKECKGMQRLN